MRYFGTDLSLSSLWVRVVLEMTFTDLPKDCMVGPLSFCFLSLFIYLFIYVNNIFYIERRNDKQYVSWACFGLVSSLSTTKWVAEFDFP